MDFYTEALIEAFLNTVSPIFGELTAAAMAAFGGYDMPLAAAMAALGGIGGALAMWILGRGLYRFAPALRPNQERYARLYDDVHRYGIWVLLLVWLPVGFMIALAAGFFRVPLRIAMPLMIAAMAAYYGLTLVA